MAEYQDREHYIPLRKSDLITTLANDLASAPEAEQFRRFAKILSATFHYEYLELLEDLEELYAYFDPDTVTPPLLSLNEPDRPEREKKLYERFHFLMERANFKKLSEEQIREARKKTSELGLNMSIDFKIFDRLEIYSRGETIGERPFRRWYRPWKVETLRLPLFQRLAIYAKLHPNKRLPPNIHTSSVYLKLIKDIPRMDLEMMVPGATPKMPSLQRYKLGGSVVGGGAWVGYGVIEQLAKTALTTELMFGPLSALLGYGYKQYFDYHNTRKDFNLRLTTSLYFQTLSNNLGVLHHLIDEAEQQDFREALLAYYFLWRRGEVGLTSAGLDDLIESELERLTKIKVDFEIEDGLAKLERLGLVTQSEDRSIAVPIDAALRLLDEKWDNLFSYHRG